MRTCFSKDTKLSIRYMSNYPYIFCKAFCYLPTPFFLLYVHIHIHVHTFERQLHVIYNFMLHLHWKSNLCTTHSHSWKAISYHMFLLWEAFSCHFQYICTFTKHLATYSTYTCTWWTTFSHYLGIRKTWCSPNQVLALKGNLTNMLSLSCLLVFQQTKAWAP